MLRIATAVNECFIARGAFAVRLIERVLEADPGVEASTDRICEEYPCRLSVAML
jgi:hypothetical protein